MKRSTVILIMIICLLCAIVIDIRHVSILQDTIHKLNVKVSQQELEIQRIQNEYNEYKENYKYISGVVNR